MPNLEPEDHLAKLCEGLTKYAQQNRELAIDQPANDFERAVNEHAELQAMLEKAKDLLKPVEAAERVKREAIADVLRPFFGDKLKEGVNDYALSNGRTLKFTNKVDRKVEASQVQVARDAFAVSADAPAMAFDDLLRVKYELAATPFKKVPVGGEASKAVARMLTVKFAASVVKVD